jgi:opacity protein-like surface antigen
MPQLIILRKGKTMFLKQTALAAAALVLVSASAQAQVAVTADLGTQGAGVHLVVPMETYLNGRFGFNYLKHDLDKTSGSVNYNIKAKLQTFDVLFDYYPIQASKLRLTGGIIYNGTQADAIAKPVGGSFSLNGNTYSLADVGVLDGEVDFRKAAPYLGVGFGNALSQDSRWQFHADLGAFYQGKANVRLASIGCTTSKEICKRLVTDVEAERAKLADDMSDYKVYPVLRASVSFRF